MILLKTKQNKKSTTELVAEIHETFNTEVDRLLEEANILKPSPKVDTELINKADRLSALGFSNTKETQLASKISNILDSVNKVNHEKQKLKEAITYFSNKYPLYKFITEESVKKICEKYNLIYGSVNKYIGTVPDKNLLEIENFKIDDNDELWEKHSGSGRIIYTHKSEALYKNKIAETTMFGRHTYGYLTKANMEIAAPTKDFNTEGMIVSDFKLINKIEIPDPVVLKPVIYNSSKYYLIVTVWGDEAGDEMIVNHKFN
jgi:hypothetical protein